MAVKRGQCPVCRYRYPLRRDGTMQAHPVYCGSECRECDGAGMLPQAPSPEECGACMDYLNAHPMLVGACASVGIERGKPTGTMLSDYLADFHQHGHQEVA